MVCSFSLLTAVAGVLLTAVRPLHAQAEAAEPRVVIVVDSLDRASFANLGELLQARVPGLHVARTGDGGIRWFMRGPSSVLESHPLILVDDVRMNVAGSAMEEIGTRPPLIDEIDIEEVERIEVWSGAATTARFGSGAGNGVIRIVTTAPRSGPLAFRVATAVSLLDESFTYPTNFFRPGVNSSGTPVRCTLQREATGFCTPTGPLASINVLETDNPFETGLGARVAGSVTSGSERVAWRTGATFDRQESTTGDLASQRVHVRGSAVLRPTPVADIAARALWTHGDADLPSSNPFLPSLLRQGLLARADTAWSGFVDPPASPYNSMRYGGALDARWHPRTWLDAGLTTGLARMTDENDFEYTLPGGVLFPSAVVDSRGERRRRDWTARAQANARYVAGGLRHSTSLTLEHVVWKQEEEFSSVTIREGFPAFMNAFGINRRTAIAGAGLAHRMHLGSRVTVAGGTRLDQIRINDQRWDVPWSPHLALTWDAIPLGVGTHVRLRAALGDAATVPQTTPAVFLFFSGSAERPKAEVTREREAGFDARVLRDRLAMSFTWYTKRTSNVMNVIAAPQPGPPAMANRIEVLNRGIEASVQARILGTSRFGWTLRAQYSYNHNEVTDGTFRTPLAFDQDLFQSPSFNFRQWIAQGQPLGAHRSSRIVAVQDLDGDGLLDGVCSEGFVCEVVLGLEDDFRPAYPPTSASVETSVRYRAVTLSALIDHRSGHVMHNATLETRCFMGCRPLYDRETPVREQAEAMLAGPGSNGMPAPNAGYTKLREVSLRLEAPVGWAGALGVSRLHLSLAGRNLVTWTDYPGLDPETTSRPWHPLFNMDSMAEPLPRRFSVRITVTK